MFKLIDKMFSELSDEHDFKYLDNPNNYPGLMPIAETTEVVVQLFLFPTFEPACSWTIYCDEKWENKYLLRRVCWDSLDFKEGKAGIKFGDSHLYGSDVFVPENEINTRMTELAKIHCPIYAPENCISLDGIDFGIRCQRVRQSAEIWWSCGYTSWSALETWHAGIIAFCESLLP